MAQKAQPGPQDSGLKDSHLQISEKKKHQIYQGSTVPEINSAASSMGTSPETTPVKRIIDQNSPDHGNKEVENLKVVGENENDDSQDNLVFDDNRFGMSMMSTGDRKSKDVENVDLSLNLVTISTHSENEDERQNKFMKWLR